MTHDADEPTGHAANRHDPETPRHGHAPSPNDLKRIVKAHELWLESDFQEGRQADLNRSDLKGADLRRANLKRAILKSADLSGADLQGINFGEADLRGTNLEGAALVGANLAKADLRGSNLRDAGLLSADLRGADLAGATLAGAYLSQADLRDARNLRAEALRQAEDWEKAYRDEDLALGCEVPIFVSPRAERQEMLLGGTPRTGPDVGAVVGAAAARLAVASRVASHRAGTASGRACSGLARLSLRAGKGAWALGRAAGRRVAAGTKTVTIMSGTAGRHAAAGAKTSASRGRTAAAWAGAAFTVLSRRAGTIGIRWAAASRRGAVAGAKSAAIVGRAAVRWARSALAALSRHVAAAGTRSAAAARRLVAALPKAEEGTVPLAPASSKDSWLARQQPAMMAALALGALAVFAAGGWFGARMTATLVQQAGAEEGTAAQPATRQAAVEPRRAFNPRSARGRTARPEATEPASGRGKTDGAGEAEPAAAAPNEGPPPRPDGADLKAAAEAGTFIVTWNAITRARPTTEARRTGFLRKGTLVDVTGTASNGDWYQVLGRGGRTDYVHASLLRKIDAEKFVLRRDANLRQEPSVQARKLDVLRRGRMVTVTGKVAGAEWYEVERNGGHIAYIHASLLRKARPQAFVVVRDAIVRVEPSATAKEFGVLKRGTRVEVTGKVGGRNWYRIERWDGGVGYVHGSMLHKS